MNVLGEWREGRAREAAESRELEVQIAIITMIVNILLIIIGIYINYNNYHYKKVGGEVVVEQERKLRVVREGHAPSDKVSNHHHHLVLHFI